MDALLVTYLEGLSKQLAEVRAGIKELKDAMARKDLLAGIDAVALWNSPLAIEPPKREEGLGCK